MPDPIIPGFAPPCADRMTARRRRGNAPSADTAGRAIRPERLVPRETEPAHKGDRERVHIACPGAEVRSTSPLTAPGCEKPAVSMPWKTAERRAFLVGPAGFEPATP